jgi:hypothetical protein
VLLVVAVTSTGYALHAQHTAIDQRNAATAQNALNQAAALDTTDSALALQLGLAAYRIAPRVSTRSALLSMMTAPFAGVLTVPGMQMESVAFNPDGRTLATGGLDLAAHRSVVLLWDVSGPRRPRAEASLSGPIGETDDVAFSPNGRTLAVGVVTNAAVAGDAGSSFDGEITLWDVADPRHPESAAALTGTTTEARQAAAFSPDARTLAVGGGTYPQLLETDVDHAAGRICELAGSALDASAWSRYLPGIPYRPPCRAGSRA